MVRVRPEDYVYEKLCVALDSLATGPGDVRARLHSAFLGIHTLQDTDFPEHLRAEFRWVWGQLNKFPPTYRDDGMLVRGSVEETLSKIRRATGVKIAKRVVSLYHAIEHYVHER
jgi:hypothetical protein